MSERERREPGPERERDEIEEIDEDEVEEIIEELAEHPDLPEADVVEQHQSVPVDEDEYRDG